VVRRKQEYFPNPMPFDAYVSILAMPIGVLICFGPALLIWVRAESKDSGNDANDGANAP